MRRLRGSPFDRDDFLAGGASGAFLQIDVDQHSFGCAPWTFAEQGVEHLYQMIDEVGEPLGQVLAIGQGMQTGRNNVFAGLAQSWVDSSGLVTGQYYARAHNSDILRFGINDRGDRVLYLEDVCSFAELPSLVQDYLKVHENELKSRAAYIRGDCEWWKYTWPLQKHLIDRARIYCPYLARSNRFAVDLECRYLGLTDTTVLYDAGQSEDMRYFVALLNSSLFTFRFRRIGKLKSSGIIEYFWNSVSRLQVRRIDFGNARERAFHDALARQVMHAEGVVARLFVAKTGHDRAVLEREAAAVDRKIDRLVYELYGLSPTEIELVEASSAG